MNTSTVLSDDSRSMSYNNFEMDCDILLRDLEECERECEKTHKEINEHIKYQINKLEKDPAVKTAPIFISTNSNIFFINDAMDSIALDNENYNFRHELNGKCLQVNIDRK